MRRRWAGFSIAYFTAFAAGGVAHAADLPEVEALVVRSTNAFRAEQGLGRLGVDPALSRAARGFVEYMARTDNYGHRADGREPEQRARARGYDPCLLSENIAYSFTTGTFGTAELASRFVEGWKESPGHRKNMVEPAATDIGVAVAKSAGSGKYYAVQMFGRPKARMAEFRVTNVARRGIDYRVGDKTWSLAPNAARVHKVCGLEDVSFPTAEKGKGRTIRPSGGENLVARGDRNIVVDVR